MADPAKISAQILEAPQAGEGRSQQLDLGQWAYDEHKCAPPIVDPVILAQLYSRNTAHKACVDAKTANCVGLGWELKSKDDADPDKAAEQAQILKSFLELCARRDGKTFTELLTSARKDEEAVGWAAVEITRNGKGKIDGLFHIHAYTLRRRKDRDGWVQKVNGEYVYFREYGIKAEDTKDPDRFKKSNEILVIGEDSPDSPFYPMPDVVPALGDVAGDEAAQLYQVQFFRNNAVPRIAICVEGGQLDDETKSYVLKYLAEGIRGDAHKTLLLQAPQGAGNEVRIRIEKLTVGTNEDAHFMDYRRWCRDTVLMAHRVSPSKVTIVEDANRSNTTDQDKTFKEQVLKPDQERYEARIQWLLEDEFGADIPVEFRFKEMDLEDEQRIAQTRAVYMPAMTNNEVRDFIDLPPAGTDPETGKVVDPGLEEWGRAPFEQQSVPNQGGMDMGADPFGGEFDPGTAPTPEGPPEAEEPMAKIMRKRAFRRFAPTHADFVANVSKLGYLIERIEESVTPGDDPYADPAAR